MKTVLTHGVFDVLHFGHVAYLRKAKSYGDKLIVSITSDKYVNKGPGRPYFNQDVRAKMLMALSVVDEVIISDSPSAIDVIKTIRPDYYVKGQDYSDRSKDVTGQIYEEEAAVTAFGGKLVFTNEETYSSSSLINRFFSPWSDDQIKAINEVKELGGMETIREVLDKVRAEIKVAVVGETIWDVYKFVKPGGISSKSPSISAQYSYEEHYQGGAWAIVKHIEDFCKVNLVTSHVAHTKTRYISESTGQRLLEITDHPDEGSLPDIWPDHNLCIVADFGHGLINQNNIKSEGFRALNVQANSSNYGFNVFTKHEDWDYLVLDQREVRLAYNDKTSSAIDLGFRAHGFNASPVGLTLGPQGSAFFHKGNVYTCPSFTDSVVDATGAGDAYLALTSLLVRIDAHPVITNFLGNVFAGLKTKIIGNKASVTKAQLLKACEAILK